MEKKNSLHRKKKNLYVKSHTAVDNEADVDPWRSGVQGRGEKNSLVYAKPLMV